MLLRIPSIVAVVLNTSFGPNRSDKPWTASASLPGPVLFQIILAGLEASTANIDNNAYQAIQHGVNKDPAVFAESASNLGGTGATNDSRYQTICNTVAERYKSNDHKRWQHVANVVPVDLCNLPYHHTTDLGVAGVSELVGSRTSDCQRMSHHDKCATRCPRRQRSKDGREEDGDQEAQTSDYGCETRSTALGYTCAAFDEGRDRRASEQGTNGYEEGICAICQRRTRKVSILTVDHATETRHGVEGSSGINDVNVEKCEEGENELGSGIAKGPVKLVQCLLHRMPRDDLFEEVESCVPFLSIGKVSDSCAASYNVLAVVL